jgi:hypothetical protein
MEWHEIQEHCAEATERKLLARYKRRHARQERDALRFHMHDLERKVEQKMREEGARQ